MTPRDDAPTLARLARCSSACYELAIPLLYSHVHLYSERQLLSLLSDLSPPSEVITATPGKSNFKTKERQVRMRSRGLVYIPLSFYDHETENRTIEQGKGTRKLFRLYHIGYITVHFIPVLEDRWTWKILVEDSIGESYDMYFPFPRVAGIAFGKGFVETVAEFVFKETGHLESCSDPTHAPEDFPSDEDGELSYKMYELSEGMGNLRRYLLPSVRTSCVHMEDLPSGLCPRMQIQLMESLSDYSWGLYIPFCTHSTFPRHRLAPWTRTWYRSYYRHYIHVDTDPSNYETDIVQDLAEDVWSIAHEILERLEEKAPRRNFVYSGITKAQVREVEQRFVDIVSERFDRPRLAIIQPIRRSPRPPPTEDEYRSDSEFSNHGGDNGSGHYFEREDLTRDYQKRVRCFDFLHASETSRCQSCGEGADILRKAGDRHQLAGFQLRKKKPAQPEANKSKKRTAPARKGRKKKRSAA